MFLSFNGLTFQTDNVGYIKVESITENGKKSDKYFLEYRKKASLKQEEINISFSGTNPTTFFAKYNFFRLDNYFINPRNIIFINELPVKDNFIKLHIAFKDGTDLTISMDKKRYIVWRNNRLRT